MRLLFTILSIFTLLKASSQNVAATGRSVSFIGQGQVADVATSGSTVYVAWGNGDSIKCSFSIDNGATFSPAEVVDVVPGVFSFAMRGPQIAAVSGGACIIVSTQKGNLLAYQKAGRAKWTKTGRVNDADTTVKEGLLDLQSDGEQNLFAAWLDVRKDRRNNIFGARSSDGGKTWKPNQLVYQSPDGHVCECCKPSVAMQGNSVAVMFRNFLNGSRDLYLMRSSNKGATFGSAEKLGAGTWKLNGCPMDGGGLAMLDDRAETVWRRKDTVFAAAVGQKELALGIGRNCTMTTAGGREVYAWVEDGEVVVLTRADKKLRVGKGSLPVLKGLANNQVIVVWQRDKEIEKAVVGL